MAFHVLMYAIIVFHFLVIGYLIFGGFLILKWPKTLWTHLVICIWGLMIIAMPGIVCPLTWSENWARQRAGLAPYSGGFINRYLENVLYPGRLTPYVQSSMALMVLCSWVVAYVYRRRLAASAVTELAASAIRENAERT